MSPDTNNNLENEAEDEGDDNDDDDEVEPVFKFSPIISVSTNDEKGNRAPLPEFSCMAVHERFLAIGKMNGEIVVTDHLGHEIPQYKIKAHAYPVNAISIDDTGEFIASCCQDGSVKISGLISKDNDQYHSYQRPVRALCLDPNFSKTKMFVSGCTEVTLHERGTFGRHKSTVLVQLGNSLIHTLRWQGTYIAFGNDRGVGVYDLQARRILGFEEMMQPKEVPHGLYLSRISWNDASTLAVVCGQTIRILRIVTEAVSAHQTVTSKKYLDTIYTLKIQFYACGLTSVKNDLILLGIEQFSTKDGSADPSLTILTPKDRTYEEKAHDPFHFRYESETNPSQFQLEYLPDEKSFFILSPYDIIKAARRNFDDHIDYLLEKKRFDEAILSFEQPRKDGDLPRRHSQKSVYHVYVQYLMANNQIEKAVTYFERIYTTVNEWEEQIRWFIEQNKLDIIVPFIPTERLPLSPQIYEDVLTSYLQRQNYEKLLELLRQWPSNLYSLTSIDQKIRLATHDRNSSEKLLECSAIIAEKQGNVSRTLDILLKTGNIQVFQLIERKKLYGSVLPQIDKLMEINEKLTLEMLINHMDKLPVNAVADSLEKSPRYLHKYLDAVFSRNPMDSRDFHTRQVSLYAEFEREKLLPFLRKAGNYNLQEALAICEQKKLHREMVFLYGRAGNGPVALQIILKELQDIELAIQFCRETGSKPLWESLIQQSKDKPDYIKGLLDHAGSDVDLKDLIDQMRTDLHVPGLRDSLCKIMQDYNIQMSLSECCRKIIVRDCLSLRKQTVTLLQHGYLVKDSDVCAKCHNPVYTGGHSGNPTVSVFFCLHVFHMKCIENNPDVCGVCSTSSLFTTA